MAYSTDIYRDGNNVYVNLSLYNPNDALIPATIDVSLEKPIVEKADEYKLSVIRFTCPLRTIPRYLLYNVNINVAIHYAAAGGITGYGNASNANQVDSIAYFIVLINQAFSVAYNNFASAMAQNGYSIPNSIPPYFMYDPRTRLMAFVVNSIFINNTFTTPPIPFEIHVSNDIFYYINSFPTMPTSIFGYTRLRVLNLDYNVFTSSIYPSGNQSAYINYQEFPTDFNFNNLQSIIVSTSLPVRNEFIPLSTGQKLQTVNPGLGTTGLSYISSIPVLIDYIVPVEQFGQQNQKIFYYPTAEFRWTDLISSLPIDRLSFTFYYQTTDQNIYPLTIEEGDYVSIKILLKRIKD
jgi:hypothetical protein